MDKQKRQSIYKIVMLIVITALITSIITTIYVYNKMTGFMDIGKIAESENVTGLELTLTSLRAMIEEEYIGEIDDGKMIESAIKGYVAGVGDEYTEYYTKDEMSDLLDSTNGNYVGIGVYMLVNNETGQINVINPMEGSPAEAAGIKTGDIITKVNDEEVTKENVEDITSKIKGEEGTKVKITVLRGKEVLEFNVERKKIVMSHINSEILENSIGYINIKDFDGGVADEFKTKYKELENKGAKSLIIDIRNNGGGVVSEALDILDMLLPKNTTLLITVDKNNEEDISKAQTEKEIDVPVIVLINGYSASASEILAGALKDNNRAELVGTTTYGKGVIQTLHTLTDGSGLKITSEEYCTPNRSKINKVGIDPDYKVEMEKDEKEDSQLNKAIELLK